MAKHRRVGRPLTYESPELLEEKINSYFMSLEAIYDDNDEIIKDEEYPTITGLTLYLGFANKVSLYQYAEREGFDYLIKSAITWVENEWEDDLRTKHSKSAQFALKAFGDSGFNWKGVHNTEGESGDIIINI